VLALKRMTPESPGPFPITGELVADLMRQKNHMAVWQYYAFLEALAFPRWRTDGIALIRIFLSGTRERRGTRSDHCCGRCDENHIRHDISIAVLRSARRDLSPVLSTYVR
jgi:hypothetical protein